MSVLPMSYALDHLVYATPDLHATVANIEARFGVQPAFGGRHPKRGTMNALIALSDSSYLEIIGPSDDDDHTRTPRWFDIDTLTAPRLIAWAIRTPDVERTAAVVLERGVALGPIAEGSRRTASGDLLAWRLTDPTTVVEDGLVPFLIDWGASAHPASSAPRGLRLVALRAEHPHPSRVERALAALDIALPIVRGDRAALIAMVDTPLGPVELR